MKTAKIYSCEIDSGHDMSQSTILEQTQNIFNLTLKLLVKLRNLMINLQNNLGRKLDQLLYTQTCMIRSVNVHSNE